MGHDSNKELEKISNLKKWQPVFFWGVKKYFGILSLKWCNFRHEKKGFNVIGFDPIKILTRLAPQIDCLKLSFVKDINEVGEKMTINNHKMLITRSTMK